MSQKTGHPLFLGLGRDCDEDWLGSLLVHTECASWLVEISWVLGPALGCEQAHPFSGCL